jgi:hypothetical protein
VIRNGIQELALLGRDDPKFVEDQATQADLLQKGRSVECQRSEAVIFKCLKSIFNV